MYPCAPLSFLWLPKAVIWQAWRLDFGSLRVHFGGHPAQLASRAKETLLFAAFGWLPAAGACLLAADAEGA